MNDPLFGISHDAVDGNVGSRKRLHSVHPESAVSAQK